MNDEEFLEKLIKWADEGTNLFLIGISVEKVDPVDRIMLEAFEKLLEETKDKEDRLLLQLNVLSGSIANVAEHLKKASA